MLKPMGAPFFFGKSFLKLPARDLVGENAPTYGFGRACHPICIYFYAYNTQVVFLYIYISIYLYRYVCVCICMYIHIVYTCTYRRYFEQNPPKVAFSFTPIIFEVVP